MILLPDVLTFTQQQVDIKLFISFIDCSVFVGGTCIKDQSVFPLLYTDLKTTYF